MSLFFKKKKCVTEMPDVSHLYFEVGNLQGNGKREYQEDAFCVANVFDEVKQREQGLLFAVCDGMGGLNDGSDASKTAVDIIRKDFFEIDRKDDISVQLRKILTSCCDAISGKYHGTSGSTGIVSVIYEDRLYFASVGDSYLYLLREGVAVRLNELHNHGNTIYEECIAGDNWNPFIARNDEQKAALTSYLGTVKQLKTDSTLRPIELMPGDVILACSDGVGTCVEEDELKSLLLSADAVESLRRIEKKVIDTNNPNQDNYTAIVVCVR